MSQLAPVTVIGGGLAGSEAAWQLACAGVPVRLYEMKPDKMTPAHKIPELAELVCSNSLRSDRRENAVGLLKAEMRLLNSLILACADATAVPAGRSLAVDRDLFARAVTDRLEQHPQITIIRKKVDQLPQDGLVIVATGPLTSDDLAADICKALNIDTLHFFDAAAPIVYADSLNMDIVFRQSRYNRGNADYFNCPLSREQYDIFQNELVNARPAPVEDFDNLSVFEGCLPLEVMAGRGHDTIRYGPLKPVGLIDPRSQKTPYACVQLRQDNRAASLYNLVGFQTRLRQSEQKRVFRLIPGLENAEFARYGVMHRNTYLPAPQILDCDYSVRGRENLYFAGQITGVEGYVESAASGLIAGWQAALARSGISRQQRLEQVPSAATVIGSMAHYISDRRIEIFQPMNANFGLVEDLPVKIKNKAQRLEAIAARSQAEIGRIRR